MANLNEAVAKAEVIDDGTDQGVEPVLDVSPELVDKYMFRLPRAYTFGDYIWPGLLMTADRLEKLVNFEFRATDVLICSYPKSGTTWISEIVSLLVHHGDVDEVKRTPLHERVPWLELDESFAWVRFYLFWQMISRMVGLGVGENIEDADDGKRRVFFTHLPLELLPRSALESRCKIVYVSRNPKDNAVSFFHFHQMARFLGLQKTTWSEFFPLYTVGKIYCGSWFEHVQGFWKYSQVCSNVLFLKYEDMKADLRGEVGRTADFLGMQLTDEVIERVARHSTFGAMKENKMANRQGTWLFDQTVSKFMRKGEVGDWRNYFTLAQSELFDRVYEARMRSTPELHFDFGDDSAESKRAVKARCSLKPPKHVDEGLPPSPSDMKPASDEK